MRDAQSLGELAADLVARHNDHFRRVAATAAKEQERSAREQARQARVRRLRDAGVPERYGRAALATHTLGEPSQSMRQATEAALDNRWRWLALCGGTGSGKSTAAAWWLAWHWPAAAVWAASADLAALPLSTQWGREELERAAAAPCLVLDDLGSDDAEGSGLAAPVRRLLARRYEQPGRTVITSNLLPRDVWQRLPEESRPAHSLESYLGERLTDRLRQVARVELSRQTTLRAPAHEPTARGNHAQKQRVK